MGIKVDKKNGLNPAMAVCPCCGKEYGVLLLGTSYKENVKPAKVPFRVMTDKLCDSCSDVVKSGKRFFIEVRDGESHKNPYRTGRIAAVKKEICDEIFNVKVQNINYMEQSAFSQLFANAPCVDKF